LMRTDDTASWVERLMRHDIVVAGVERLEDALAGELAETRGMVATIPTLDGPIRVVGSPFHMPDFEASYAAPPLLGEHNAALLAEDAAA